MVRTASVGCLLLMASLAAGCGDAADDGGSAAAGTGDRPTATGSSTLTVTRDDGTTYELGDLELTCDGSGDDASITVTSPAGRDPDGSMSFFLLRSPLADAVGDHDLPWKTTVDDTTGAVVFVYDSETGAELSSDAGETPSGTVSITTAECGDEPRFEADVDVTLTNEHPEDPGGQVAGQIRLEA